MTKVLVNIDVDDLERGIQFYTAALGLRLGRRFGTDGVELIGADVPIYLLAKASGSAFAPGMETERFYRRHWTPVHIDVVVEHLDPALERAKEVGATLEAPIDTLAWGRMALLSDPFGHGFCLIEFTGRGYDEIATA